MSIFIVFHSGSKYDYHFIIKWLTEKFENEFTCLKKILKILNLFSFNTKGSYRNKNREESTKTASHRLQFIDCVRFMASSYQIIIKTC